MSSQVNLSPTSHRACHFHGTRRSICEIGLLFAANRFLKSSTFLCVLASKMEISAFELWTRPKQNWCMEARLLTLFIRSNGRRGLIWWVYRVPLYIHRPHTLHLNLSLLRAYARFMINSKLSELFAIMPEACWDNFSDTASSILAFCLAVFVLFKYLTLPSSVYGVSSWLLAKGLFHLQKLRLVIPMNISLNWIAGSMVV